MKAEERIERIIKWLLSRQGWVRLNFTMHIDAFLDILGNDEKLAALRGTDTEVAGTIDLEKNVFEITGIYIKDIALLRDIMDSFNVVEVIKDENVYKVVVKEGYL